MNKLFASLSFCIVATATSVSARAAATPDFGPPPAAGNGGPPEPPAEAFAACADKVEGASVTIVTPSGATIAAICGKFGDRLAARPARRPSRDLPPPEQ